MNELENGIQYGQTYHTFYTEIPEKEQRKRFITLKKVWYLRTRMWMILQIAVFFMCIPFVVEKKTGFIVVQIFCLLLIVNNYFSPYMAMRLLKKSKVTFDEKEAHYSVWLTGRYFRTEHVGYDEIGHIEVGDFPMAIMPRLGRDYLISKDACKETFGKFINVYGLGINVLFSMQYTQDRLDFFKTRCKEDMPVTFCEDISAS